MPKLFQLWNNSAPLRYLIVGGWNFVFGYGIFALLYWAFNGRWTDWFIATVATILGITMSYLTHRFITYRSHGCWWKEYLRFYVVYGGQSLLNIRPADLHRHRRRVHRRDLDAGQEQAPRDRGGAHQLLREPPPCST